MISEKVLRPIRRKSRALTKTQVRRETAAVPPPVADVLTRSLPTLDVSTGAGSSTSAAVERCTCLAGKIAEASGVDPASLGEAELAAFASQCASAEAEVFKTMADAGVKVDGCRIWYMRRQVWMIGGAVGAGLLALKLLR